MSIINYRNSADDGWIQVYSGPHEHSVAWFIAGDLEVGLHPFVFENLFDYDILILRMKANLGTVSNGSSVLLEPQIDTFAFLAEDYEIPEGENGSLVEDNEGLAILYKGSKLTLEILQIGSSAVGADLTFQIIGRKM